MSNRPLLIGATLLLVAVGYVAATKLYQQETQEQYRFLATKDAETFVRDHSPRKGDPNAPVYLVEFLDPECESCRAFHPFVKKILDEYSQVQLVVRYAPFHQNSVFAVRLLEASRKQDLYWQALDAAFDAQPQWGDHHHPKPQLLWDVLQSAGVDIEQVKKDMNDPKIDDILKQDQADLKELGVRRTPTFFVNGVPLLEFGYEPLKKLIKQEIERAQRTSSS